MNKIEKVERLSLDNLINCIINLMNKMGYLKENIYEDNQLLFIKEDDFGINHSMVLVYNERLTNSFNSGIIIDKLDETRKQYNINRLVFLPLLVE